MTLQPVATSMTARPAADFDYLAFLATLEPFRLTPLPLPDEARLPKWVWPMTKTYNGFTGEQRVRNWQVERWGLDRGLISKPTRCSICANRSDVAFHSEDYSQPWTPIPVCKQCHSAIHLRFRCPAPWDSLKARHHRHGVTQWFDFLSSTPIDLAGWLADNRP
jgi:hypothetical protein